MIVLEGQERSDGNAWIQNCCIGGSRHCSNQKTVGMAELEDKRIHRFGGTEGWEIDRKTSS
jgi:hypothetical protein